MGIDAYCGCIRYVLGGRADGEGGRGKRETAIISSIKVVVAIAVRTSPLITLYYI